MGRRTLAALLISMVLLVPTLRAEGTEPQIYLFWSASCPYSKAARTFLAAAQGKDPRLSIRDFEVDGSAANTRLLGRLYEKINLAGLWVVPVVVIGHYVVIGYIDDETTGAEILSYIAQCRRIGCKDAVRGLIEDEGTSTKPLQWLQRPGLPASAIRDGRFDRAAWTAAHADAS